MKRFPSHEAFDFPFQGCREAANNGPMALGKKFLQLLLEVYPGTPDRFQCQGQGASLARRQEVRPQQEVQVVEIRAFFLDKSARIFSSMSWSLARARMV